MDLLCAAGALSLSEDTDSDGTNSDADYAAFEPNAMKLIRYQTIEDLETNAGCYKHVKPYDGSFKIEIETRLNPKRGRRLVFSKGGFATAKDAATALIALIDKKREEMEGELPEWLLMTPADKVPPPPSTWQWPSEGDTLKVEHDCNCCMGTEVDATVRDVCSNGWLSAFIQCRQESAGGYIDWFKWNDTDWRYANALYRNGSELAASDADSLLEQPKKKMRLPKLSTAIDGQALVGTRVVRKFAYYQEGGSVVHLECEGEVKAYDAQTKRLKVKYDNHPMRWAPLSEHQVVRAASIPSSPVQEAEVAFSTDAWEKLVSTPNGQRAGRLLQMLRITFSGIEQVHAPSDAAYKVMEDETGQPVWVELLHNGQIMRLPVFEHIDGTIFISKTNPSASNVTDKYKEHAVSTYHMLHLLGASAVYFNHMPKEYKPAVFGLPLKIKFPDWSVQSHTAVAKAPPAPPQPRAPSLKATPSPQPNLSVMPKAATCTSTTTKFCAMNGDSCLKMPLWCRFCRTCGSKQV